jgi:hypothetical protein
VGAIYSEEDVPDGKGKTHYQAQDPNKGHDHTFFIQHRRDVFADWRHPQRGSAPPWQC